MNRRGFIAGSIASLLGLFGIKQAKAVEPVQRQSVDLMKFSRDIADLFDESMIGSFKDVRGFRRELKLQFAETLYVYLRNRGAAWVWMIPNVFGKLLEVHVMTCESLIPQPISPGYPMGSFRFDLGGGTAAAPANVYCLIPAQCLKSFYKPWDAHDAKCQLISLKARLANIEVDGM